MTDFERITPSVRNDWQKSSARDEDRLVHYETSAPAGGWGTLSFDYDPESYIVINDRLVPLDPCS